MDQFYIIYIHTLFNSNSDYTTGDREIKSVAHGTKEEAIKDFQFYSWNNTTNKKNNVFLYEITEQNEALMKQLISSHITWGNKDLEQEQADNSIDQDLERANREVKKYD